MRLFWEAWRAYTGRAAAYQSTTLLNAAYVIAFGPTAVAARLFGGNLLDLDTRPQRSYWLERKPSNTTLADLTRQF
jgi:hypothetical protein